MTMEQYIQIAHTHADYIAGGTKYNTPLNPQVTECEFTEDIHYSAVNGPIIATIEVTDDSQKTRIFDKFDWQFHQDYAATYGYDGTITDAFVRIVIDGVEIDMQEAWDYGSEYFGEWQLSAGSHTIEYYLRNTKDINTYDNWDGPSYLLFDSCNEITEMHIPEGCRILGGDSLRGQEGLTTLVLPQSLRTIGYEAVAFCDKLRTCAIPSGVTAIEGMAFMDADFQSITLPEPLKYIGERAFEGCRSLTSIHIPKNVEQIDVLRTSTSSYTGEIYYYYSQPFALCASLQSITVDPMNPRYYSPNGCNAIIQRDNMYLVSGCINTVIPYGVRTIGGYAFSGCTSLEHIDIPDTVTEIKDYAFYYCENLHSITIPASVTSIGANAFYTMSNAYYGVTNPGNMLTGGVTLLSTTPPNISTQSFGAGSNMTTPTTYQIYVPAQAVQTYKTAWPQYAQRIQAIQ